MEKDKLKDLLKEYKKAPKEFQVANYWASYEKQVIKLIARLNLSQLRSGKYPILSTFGFIDGAYTYHPSLSFWKKFILKFIHKYIIKNRAVLPYKLKKTDIEEMAFRHCELLSDITNSVPIGNVEVSTFGNPKDVFEINGRKYTVPFLSYYRRYCFAQKNINFKGNEVVVELGSGSGYQIEVLKKLYPKLTVLCFDLPSQLYLCEKYLTEALGMDSVVGTGITIGWNDMSALQKGKVHFLGVGNFLYSKIIVLIFLECCKFW